LSQPPCTTRLSRRCPRGGDCRTQRGNPHRRRWRPASTRQPRRACHRGIDLTDHRPIPPRRSARLGSRRPPSFWRVGLGASQEGRTLLGALARDITSQLRRLESAVEPLIPDAAARHCHREYPVRGARSMRRRPGTTSAARPMRVSAVSASLAQSRRWERTRRHATWRTCSRTPAFRTGTWGHLTRSVMAA